MPFNGSTNTFNIVSELKTQIGNANTRVNVLGYTTSGDGGGGEFYWDSTSTEPDNGGTIFQVTGVTTGRWKRVFSGGTLNVLWFGVKCDYTSSSTTNNVSAINSAIAAAVVLRNAGADSQTAPNIVSLYFPYGKGYRITDTITIPNNISVIADGQIVFDNVANDRPAVVIGDEFLTQRRTYVLDVTNKNPTNWPNDTSNDHNFTTNSIGIKFFNHNACEINVRRSTNFGIGVQFLGGNNVGFAYNEVTLGTIASNKVQVELSGEEFGWCNENNFYGGRLCAFNSPGINNGKSRYGVRITSSDGVYINHNNNNFYKPSFELRGDYASPGVALPILVVHGTQNAFYNCRSENNYQVSTALIRTLNDVTATNVELGYGADGTIEDLGNFPSTIVKRRARKIVEDNYNIVFDTGDLRAKVCPYDLTNTYVSGELFFLSSAGATSDFISAITITPDYIEYSASRAIGVRVDTSINKRFIVKKSTLPSFGGRTGVRCYNSSGEILYSAEVPYVKGYAYQQPSPNSAYGGHYRMGSDSGAPFYFSVSDEVAYIDVFVSGGSPNTVRIKQFQVQALDAAATVITSDKKTGLFATQIPTTGTWNTGDVIYNATPASNNIVLWQCTASGTPGTWVSVFNSNKTVTSVNGNTGDVTVAPSTGGTGYIQNTATLQASSSFFISGQGISNGNFQVRKNGLNDVLGSLTLYNFAATRGVNLQLNGDANPGMSTWVHNGTTWIKRVETLATGSTSFYGNIAISSSNPLLTFDDGVSNDSFIQMVAGRLDFNNGNSYTSFTGNANVGIGTTTPSEKLTIVGNVLVNGGNGVGFFVNGPSSIVRDNSVDIKISTNRVGINTSSAARATLDIIGGIFTENNEGLRIINDGAYIAFYNSANSVRTGFFQMATIGGAILSVEQNQGMSFRTNAQERIYIEPDGDVGIGIHTPATKLDINGQITIRGGSPGIGKVLTSDANGVASWGNITPAPAIIQGNANLVEIPSTWVSVILQHTSNNGFTSLANYPGGYTGRVVTIYNPTNFTFQLSSVTYPAKSVVYILWSSPTTPIFLQV